MHGCTRPGLHQPGSFPCTCGKHSQDCSLAEVIFSPCYNVKFPLFPLSLTLLINYRVRDCFWGHSLCCRRGGNPEDALCRGDGNTPGGGGRKDETHLSSNSWNDSFGWTSLKFIFWALFSWIVLVLWCVGNHRLTRPLRQMRNSKYGEVIRADSANPAPTNRILPPCLSAIYFPILRWTLRGDTACDLCNQF